MNVKISYTVPFEEVPNRVQDLLLENRNKVEDIATRINQINIDSTNVLSVIKSIDQIRKMLFQIDSQLADCYSILSGYNKAMADQIYGQERADDAVDMGTNNQDG